MLVRDYNDEHPNWGTITLMNEGGRGVLSHWHFSGFNVLESERGKGYGSAILYELIDLADRYGETLTLTAGASRRDWGLSTEQLVKFYKKFGFKINHDVPYGPISLSKKYYYPDARLDMVCMIREPRLRIGIS